MSAAAGLRDRPEEEDNQPEQEGGEPVHGEVRRSARGEAHGAGGAAAHRNPDRDETLTSPRCVFQVLKRHFARYTPKMVEQACGVPPDAFARVCELVTTNSGPDRTTAFVYSVGWTQHTVGAQYIRTAAILQLLLGNAGRPGGGILALRGHASIQGSTDIPTLFDLLPGYLPMPHAQGNENMAAYLAAEGMDKGFWADLGSYLVSLLKAWWGDAATAANDFCFDYLPRLTGSHGTYETVVAQIEGKCQGYFLMGENPAVGSANGRMQRFGLANLDWLVVRDLVMIESATFWQNGPEIETGEMRTQDIGTEVFFMPAAAHTEKNGSFTNTQRMLQWHHQAVEPVGDARSELWFSYHLGRRIRAKLAASTDRRDRPIQDLTWDYPVEGPPAEPSAEAVLAEINGTDAQRRPLSSYTQLSDDGSTACGCWIYCGVRAGGVNQAARRKPGTEQSWVAPEWGWAWPANRRILYNRASADPDGRPWSDRKALVWWDAEAGKWTGHDVPDFIGDRPPSYRPDVDATGVDAISGIDPFILQADGKGWLFAPAGLVDGPLPAHYEPQESPFVNPPRAAPARASPAGVRAPVRRTGGHHRRHRHGDPMSIDPAARAGHRDHPTRVGFFTDTSVCIGCKACEVACKEWNAVPEDGLSLSGMSYDNTVGLSASTWRHVAFIEQPGRSSQPGDAAEGLRWLMSSDVCKHCTEAACLDVCPTGALFRTEFGTVVVQDDVCNGCGYCVPACPFGVIARREQDGGAHKCTLCYDRLGAGLEPACAKACPTKSIQFGPLDELRARAQLRVEELREAGQDQARLYLADPADGIGGGGAFFLLLDEPEVYGLPPDPVVTTRDLPGIWKHVAVAAAGLAATAVALGLGRRR